MASAIRQPPIVTENLAADMCGVYRAVGIFAHEAPVRAVVERIDALEPAWIHAMHGRSITAQVIPAYTQALREQALGYAGMLLGREVLPAEPPAGAGPRSEPGQPTPRAPEPRTASPHR